MHWFVQGLRHYADFDGRARRTEYWMFHLIAALIAVGIALLGVGGGYLVGIPILATSGLGLFVIFLLALVIPSHAVTSRRLHDTGRSGWLQLLSWIPFGGIVVLVFTLSEGHAEPNQYGPDPKGPAYPGPLYPPPGRSVYPPSPPALAAPHRLAGQGGQAGQGGWWTRPAIPGLHQQATPGAAFASQPPVGQTGPPLGYCTHCAALANGGRFCGSCGTPTA